MGEFASKGISNGIAVLGMVINHYENDGPSIKNLKELREVGFLNTVIFDFRLKIQYLTKESRIAT